MSNNDNNTTNTNKKTIEIDKLFTRITALGTFIAVLFTVLLKFVSMGRSWYYQFDFDTFPLNVSNQMLFLMLYFVICSICGVVLLATILYLLSKIKKLKRTTQEWLSIIITNIVICLIGFSLYKIFDSKILFQCSLMLSLLSVGLSVMFLPLIAEIKNKKNLMVFISLIFVIVTLVYTGYLFHQEYSNAKEQNTFNIVQSNENYYAIINENGEKYSMYQCELIGNEIVIYDNKNLVISKENVYYDTYEFEKVSFKGSFYKYDSEKNSYEVTTENHDINN